MIPTVRNVIWVEMIRDGGSLAAKFDDENANQFILATEIHIVDRGPLLKERLGYHQPVLIDCDPKKRPPNTDRIWYSETCGPSIPVSWTDARTVVAAIAGLAHGLSPLRANWLQQMVYVIANDGRLPPDLDPTVQVVFPR